MIDEGDVPSIQCEMNLREPKSVRKVDGLSLIFIDFYVPALTPRLDSIETSLQVSDNITLFAAQTAEKTPFLCCSSITAMGTCLFTKPLLNNDSYIFAYLAVVAQQRVCMLQY
jgi:hypothetical protein